MRNLSGLISGMAACTILAASSARAQSVAVSLTGTYSGGTAYAYAETTGDYATGCYYDLCTYISAFGEEDNGTWDIYGTPGNCGSTDVEVSWTFTPTGTTDFIQFAGQHDVDILYYVYQMDEYCGGDEYACEDYWDAYEASVLENDNPGTSGSWTLYGPPAIGYFSEQIDLSTTAYAGTECPYPTSETSVSEGYADPYDYDGVEYEEAEFYAYFSTVGGYPDYTGRTVWENVNVTYETCNAQLGGPWPPASNEYFDDSSYWTVESDEAYGTDVTAIPVDEVAFYQGQMGPGSGVFQCTAYWASQAMSMNHCAVPSLFVQYDSGHTLGYEIYSSHPDLGYRGGATGAVY